MMFLQDLVTDRFADKPVIIGQAWKNDGFFHHFSGTDEVPGNVFFFE